MFDLDGVLVFSRDSHRRAFEEIFAELASTIFTTMDLRDGPTPDVFRAVLNWLSRGIDSHYSRRKTMRARELLDAGYPIAPECVAILELLGCRYRLALASSGSLAGVQSFLHHTGLEPVFGSILSGDDVRYAKPHPEIFQRSSENLGLVPSMCAVIEDSEAGIQAARAAGAHAIGIGQHFASELTAAGAEEEAPGSLRDLAVILRVL